MIDFNIDEIEACCDSLIADELEYLAPNGMNDSVKVKAFIARLRQAEKDAARYRWLRDQAGDGDVCDVLFNTAYEEWNEFIDEAMQCSK